MKNFNSSKNQQIKGEFVRREVLQNVSYLISELSTNESYQDELFEAFSCPDLDIEIFEYWLITDWFAEKLKEKGEATAEFYNLNIWGRTCTGQAILLDHVISEICNDMKILEGQKYEWKL